MKTLGTAFIFWCSSLLVVAAQAQFKPVATDVKEITIHTLSAGMIGQISTRIKVVRQGSVWHSYLVQKQARMMPSGYKKSYDSTLHRLITTLKPAVINKLMQAINKPAPALTRNTFNLTPQALIADLSRNTTATDTRSLRRIITQPIIDSVITATIVNQTVMDAYEQCEIRIITYHSGTIVLNAGSMCPTKLPWNINKRQNYDMAINNFAVLAMGSEDIPVKRALSINSLKKEIYSAIDARHPTMPIGFFNWKYRYPSVIKKLSRQFLIKPAPVYGNIYNFTLKTKAMPVNASIGVDLDMTRPGDADRLIAYATLVDQYFAKGSFVFDYYQKQQDAHLSFFYRWGSKPYTSFAKIYREIPALSQTDSLQVIDFTVTAADGYAGWMAFPDGKVLLLNHYRSKASQPAFFHQDTSDSAKRNTLFYLLYNREGKLLSPEQLKKTESSGRQ